jgi:hypothetical protein
MPVVCISGQLMDWEVLTIMVTRWVVGDMQAAILTTHILDVSYTTELIEIGHYSQATKYTKSPCEKVPMNKHVESGAMTNKCACSEGPSPVHAPINPPWTMPKASVTIILGLYTGRNKLPWCRLFPELRIAHQARVHPGFSSINTLGARVPPPKFFPNIKNHPPKI